MARAQAQPVDSDDRERTAKRLLRSSAEHFFDPDVDIDWGAPWADDKVWLPEQQVSLHGTKLWRRLDRQQRIDLGRHELVSLLSFGIWAENLLSTLLLRVVVIGPSTSQHSLYAMTEVGEESRHSTMFAKLIDKTGIPPYRQPRTARVMWRIGQLVPIGPATYGATMLVEEILDKGQRDAMVDESVQPHVRQLMRIHVVEEARHIGFARAELARGIARRGPFTRPQHRVGLALFAVLMYPMLVSTRVYPAVGIGRWRGALAARRNPHHREMRRYVSESSIRFFHEQGMLDGVVAKALWRLTGALPPDLR